jgi:endoglucanase
MQINSKSRNRFIRLRHRMIESSLRTFRKLSAVCTLIVTFFLFSSYSFCQKLQLNESGYFETPGVNVFVFSNQYNGMFFDEKTAGIEIIHHGVRTATGGAVRLQNTPEQWDLIPAVVERKVDVKNNSIDVVLRYEEYDFNSRVNVSAKDEGVVISVYLDNPLPEKLEGQAGLNLEFLPASYFEKTYLADGKPGVFPLYPCGLTTVKSATDKIPQYAGHTTFDDRERGEFLVPEPLASGKTILLAPEDPERFVKIQSEEELMLFDGRNLAQNGWYIVRSLIPPKKTGEVLKWYLEPNAKPDWKRKPVIGFSQVGYHPDQEKIAVIELDKNDTPLETASVFQVTPEGKYAEKLTADVVLWGKYLRYNYVKFDFSSVKEAGLYFIKYGDQKTNTFIIDTGVYNDIWHATLDVWFPVQMDHMQVNEAYRTWHGLPFMDDAVQAPVNHQHFDGYKMGPLTETKYKPLEHIPGLAVGGWFDAGDFDIQTGSHCRAILSFVEAWEEFRPDRDETFIDQESRYVDIHHPDGKPDILQQLEHGTLNVAAQLKNIGHPVRGIVVPNLYQYHHLGDASTETDNIPYTMDDRWVFTNRIPWMDYFSIGALAAANRALQDYNKPLADECLTLAKNLWDEDNNLKNADTSGAAIWFRNNAKLIAALQLYISTKDKQYCERFNELIWPALDSTLVWSISVAAQAFPYMDSIYKSKLKDYVLKYKEYNDGLDKENPYGIPVIVRGWGGNSLVVSWATANYYAHKAFPDIIGPEYVYKGLNYIFGCHPYSNISFVSSVGTVSKKITYGNNRADFSFIAGGMVPGLLILKPDFPENKEDWPFLWGENECVVGSSAMYIFLAGAVNELAKNENRHPVQMLK